MNETISMAKRSEWWNGGENERLWTGQFENGVVFIFKKLDEILEKNWNISVIRIV